MFNNLGVKSPVYTNDEVHVRKEDAAVVAMRRVLCMTGLKIRDYNYYNMKVLEHKIQVLESEKMTVTDDKLNAEDDVPSASAK
ncbi:hypothetical protein P8452_17061 [Trifolium repens]|nr:hypothetical protein P8452_17061 [Trifolium repens]